MLTEPTPPELARVPARSRRQAMDWSLVLASQEIEAVIDSPQTGEGWGLLVNPEDFFRATEAIRLYRLENRHWNWQIRVPGTSILFDWTSLFWVLLICFFFLLTEAKPGMKDAGLMNGASVLAGQWWRLLTAIWLHGDVSHLAANAALGLLFLGLVMTRYGTGIGLLASYFAGFGGNLAVLLLWHGQSSLGASGMVLGALGLLAADSFSARNLAQMAQRKLMLTGFGGAAMLFVLLGLSPETDWRAHIGGFVSGLFLGAFWRLIVSVKETNASPKLNWLAAIVLGLLIILPWALAARTH